ncbi:hypothetical protein B0H12DRAFT_1268314 [Mycena haematopus]|nr:hypothetical protein B0H12DRAFT_1268314 [Mycena haematopus]
MPSTLEDVFDFPSEFQRLSMPVLDDGNHIIGLASDSCVWPGISAHFATFLAQIGAPATAISHLVSTSPIVPSACSPVIPLVARILSTLLGGDPADYANTGTSAASDNDENLYVDTAGLVSTADHFHDFLHHRRLTLKVDNRISGIPLHDTEPFVTSYRLCRSYDFVRIYDADSASEYLPHTSEILVACQHLRDVVKSFQFLNKAELSSMCTFANIEHSARKSKDQLKLLLMSPSESNTQLQSQTVPVLVFKERARPRELSGTDMKLLSLSEKLQHQVGQIRKRIQGKDTARRQAARSIKLGSTSNTGSKRVNPQNTPISTNNEKRACFPTHLSKERRLKLIRNWQKSGSHMFEEKPCAGISSDLRDMPGFTGRAAARCRADGSTAPVERVPCPSRQPLFLSSNGPSNDGRDGRFHGSCKSRFKLTLVERQDEVQIPTLPVETAAAAVPSPSRPVKASRQTKTAVDSTAVAVTARVAALFTGKGKQPKDSWANFQYYAVERLPEDVAAALKNLSDYDKMMICRARASKITHLYNQKPGVYEADGTSRDTIILRQTLPPNQAEIEQSICAVFLNQATQVTRENISRHHPVLVSKDRVKTLLDFLTSNNPAYSEGLAISAQNLAHLYSGNDEAGVPVSVEIRSLARNPEGAVNEGPAIDETDSELLMEAVGYTQGDFSHGSYKYMKGVALDACLKGHKFVQIHGESVVSITQTEATNNTSHLNDS